MSDAAIYVTLHLTERIADLAANPNAPCTGAKASNYCCQYHDGWHDALDAVRSCLPQITPGGPGTRSST